MRSNQASDAGRQLSCLASALRREAVGVVEEGADLSLLSTWRIGGPADVMVTPSCEEGLARCLAALADAGTAPVVIGAGSNLLFDDAGVRGVVVRLADCLDDVVADGTTVRAGAGASTANVADIAARAGLSGLEHAANIPGSFGGLVAMNGGSQRCAVGESVVSVRAMDPNGAIVELTADECGFGYRRSVFQENGLLVFSAVLELTPDEPVAVRARMEADLAERERKFPLDLPSCGSVFKSAPHVYERFGPPGKVIEEAGLKGTSAGGAMVSPMHANFFVNMGGAASADVLSLIDLVRRRVHEHIGEWLECEVRYVSPEGIVTPAHVLIS